MITHEIQMALNELRDNIKKFGNVSNQLSQFGYNYKEINESVENLISKIDFFLEKLYELDIDRLLSNYELIQNSLSKLDNTIKNKENDLDNVLTDILNKSEEIKKNIIIQLNEISKLYKQLPESVFSDIKNIIDKFVTDFENYKNEINTFLENFVKEINEKNDEIQQNLISKYNSIIKELDNLILQKTEKYIEGKANSIELQIEEKTNLFNTEISILNKQHKQIKILLFISIGLSIISLILNII